MCASAHVYTSTKKKQNITYNHLYQKQVARLSIFQYIGEKNLKMASNVYAFYNLDQTVSLHPSSNGARRCTTKWQFSKQQLAYTLVSLV